jgi:Putative phage metallopeptidase
MINDPVEIPGIKPKTGGTIAEATEIGGPVKSLSSNFAEVPEESEFGSQDSFESSVLHAIGQGLITSKKDLGHLQGAHIGFCWKRRSKRAGGCVLATGFLAQYSTADYIIWLAADQCRGLSKFEVEAALFEQLLQTGVDKNDKFIKRSGVEITIALLREYGQINSELRALGKAFKQLAMPI